jgi:hypothetical protein
MKPIAKTIRHAAIAVAGALMFVFVSPTLAAFGQSPTAVTAPTPDSTIKALQEALNSQGIVVKVDGVLDDETRAAIRKFQSQHHVPVTGEPDKATLSKLGVRQSSAPTQSTVIAQATPMPPSTASSATPQSSPAQSGGMMMNCPMMQGQMQSMSQGHMQPMMQNQMQSMMQMMQMMQGMMQMMQAQIQSGPMQRGQPGTP